MNSMSHIVMIHINFTPLKHLIENLSTINMSNYFVNKVLTFILINQIL